MPIVVDQFGVYFIGTFGATGIWVFFRMPLLVFVENIWRRDGVLGSFGCVPVRQNKLWWWLEWEWPFWVTTKWPQYDDHQQIMIVDTVSYLCSNRQRVHGVFIVRLSFVASRLTDSDFVIVCSMFRNYITELQICIYASTSPIGRAQLLRSTSQRRINRATLDLPGYLRLTVSMQYVQA